MRLWNRDYSCGLGKANADPFSIGIIVGKRRRLEGYSCESGTSTADLQLPEHSGSRTGTIRVDLGKQCRPLSIGIVVVK
jgi:hypothetical protein